MRMRIGFLLFGGVFLWSSLMRTVWGQEPGSYSKLPTNHWHSISKVSVGPRFSPGLVFAPDLNRFVLLGGRISRGHRPYDVLSFDIERRSWRNDLPESAKGRGGLWGNVKVVSSGQNFSMKDAEGLVRPPSHLTRMWNTYTLAPWDQCVYTLVCGHTLRYNPAQRAWTDLDPPSGPVPKSAKDSESLNWGALCADPINKELLLFGGGGVNTPTGAAGTWVYSVANNTWRRLTEGPQPGPRALSPMVCDPVHGKIVLFGGDRLNMIYGDLWIYDCRSRTWSMPNPPLNPPPRFGHGLVYLPKSKKVFLSGGHTYVSKGNEYYANLPFLDAWVYDVAANTWEMLSRKAWKDLPAQKNNEASVMAANGKDEVLYVPGDGHSQRMVRTTWVYRTEAAKVDSEGTQKYGVPPGQVVYRQGPYDPQWYTQDLSPPDVKANEAFLKSAKPNQWMDVDPPKWPTHRWGGGWATCAFDSDQDQILHHGGGHSAYFGDEVAHYHISENRFTIPYRPSLPLEYCGKLDGPGSHSFTLGPWGNHSYHAYTYDPSRKRMIYMKKDLPMYDPVQGKWLYEEQITYPTEFKKFHCALIATPHGPVCWIAHQGLFQLNKTNAFEKVPVKGTLPWFRGDGSALTYDRKRDLLYFTTTPLAPKSAKGKAPVMCGQVWAYDFKTHALTAMNPQGRERIMAYRFARESVYVADQDLVMLGILLNDQGKPKVPFYDPQNNRWLLSTIPRSEFIGSSKLKGWGASVDLGLAYDAKRALVWAVQGRFQPGAIKFLKVDKRLWPRN